LFVQNLQAEVESRVTLCRRRTVLAICRSQRGQSFEPEKQVYFTRNLFGYKNIYNIFSAIHTERGEYRLRGSLQYRVGDLYIW
jgi:hypothetical protein